MSRTSTNSRNSTSSTASTRSQGTSLSDYTLGQVLGQGAYGKVILSTDKKTGKKVAIKEVNKASGSDWVSSPIWRG